MKKKRFVGILALIPLALCNLTFPVYAEVTEYQEAEIDIEAEETSAECQVLYQSTYDFSEEIPKYPKLEVSASGYEGVYDGKSHGIAVGCRTDGVTILYSTDGKIYSTKKPEYTDAGTYVTYYKVEKAGYTTAVGTEIVRIKEAAIEFDSDDCNVFYDGKKHSIDVSVKTDGCKVLYSEDGMKFTSKKPEYKEPGTYVVYYKIMRDNYATVTGSSTVTIKAKDGTNSNNQNNASQNNGNKDNSGNAVQTGDESNILLYGLLLIVSAFGLAKYKKIKEEDCEYEKTNS